MLKFFIILLCFIVIVMVGLQFWARTAKPANLGILDGGLLPCPDTPNCVSSLHPKPEHRVAPLSGSHAALERAIFGTGGEIIEQTPEYMHAIYQSRFFGFRDDLELHIKENEVDVRSVSRLGHSDLGVNAKRVAKIRELLAAESGSLSLK